MQLASHILNLEEVEESFCRVAQHLCRGGLLIVSTSNAYGDNLVELTDGIVHKRKSRTKNIKGVKYAELDYRFYRNEELLAQQILELRLLSDEELTLILEKSGFSLKVEDIEQYRVYEKS